MYQINLYTLILHNVISQMYFNKKEYINTLPIIKTSLHSGNKHPELALFDRANILLIMWGIIFTNFSFIIQTESHKNYNHPHQFTQSHVINFFFILMFVSAFMNSSVFH